MRISDTFFQVCDVFLLDWWIEISLYDLLDIVLPLFYVSKLSACVTVGQNWRKFYSGRECSVLIAEETLMLFCKFVELKYV